MSAKVSYKQGTKATYLGLTERLDTALYFCTDTKELFKGNDLYSDGLRIVEAYSDLPVFTKAADGILYYCKDTGCGYLLNEARNDWIVVIHGVDGETIEINSSGFMAVKAVPIGLVSGLDERLTAIEQQTITGGGVVIATPDVAGIVKASSEITVAADGTMTIGSVAQSKVEGLEDRLVAIEKSIVGAPGGATNAANVSYKDSNVEVALDELEESLTWREMNE